MMLRCGLLGERLSHSYSPQIHAALCGYQYKLYEVPEEKVGEFLRNGSFDGLNVTIPYKQTVIPYLDELSDTAEKIGSVNTIVRRKDGTLFGDNTDIYGLKYLLKKHEIPVENTKVLVLGSGGTSRTACFALEELGAKEVIVVSRNGENNYNNIEKHSDATVLVNTTPVGMYPNNGCAAVDIGKLKALKGVVDVIYNPAKTQLLLQAERFGIRHAGGLAMLVAQAKRSAELFTGEAISESRIDKITAKLSSEMKNIILIGMPGSGKSSLGKLVSKATGRPFVDVDEAISLKAQKSIPQIFSEEGELGFRKRETEALKEVCKLSGKVIATGGGCVTREENYPVLHQNGTIVYIKRPLDRLPSKGRPLSQKTTMEKMYMERKPMYEGFCDFSVENNERIEDALEAILKKYDEDTCN